MTKYISLLVFLGCVGGKGSCRSMVCGSCNWMRFEPSHTAFGSMRNIWPDSRMNWIEEKIHFHWRQVFLLFFFLVPYDPLHCAISVWIKEKPISAQDLWEDAILLWLLQVGLQIWGEEKIYIFSLRRGLQTYLYTVGWSAYCMKYWMWPRGQKMNSGGMWDGIISAAVELFEVSFMVRGLTEFVVNC